VPAVVWPACWERPSAPIAAPMVISSEYSGCKWSGPQQVAHNDPCCVLRREVVLATEHQVWVFGVFGGKWQWAGCRCVSRRGPDRASLCTWTHQAHAAQALLCAYRHVLLRVGFAELLHHLCVARSLPFWCEGSVLVQKTRARCSVAPGCVSTRCKPPERLESSDLTQSVSWHVRPSSLLLQTGQPHGANMVCVTSQLPTRWEQPLATWSRLGTCLHCSKAVAAAVCAVRPGNRPAALH
jgi:hypothetical protein